MEFYSITIDKIYTSLYMNQKKNKRRSKRVQSRKKTISGGDFFSFFTRPQTRKKKGNEKATIIRFHSKDCGHCVELNKIWPSLVKKKSFLFQFIDVNDKEFEKGRLNELNKKFNVNMVVNGYPTIYKIINNRFIPYEDNRDTLSLLKWMVL